MCVTVATNTVYMTTSTEDRRALGYLWVMAFCVVCAVCVFANTLVLRSVNNTADTLCQWFTLSDIDKCQVYVKHSCIIMTS